MNISYEPLESDAARKYANVSEKVQTNTSQWHINDFVNQFTLNSVVVCEPFSDDEGKVHHLTVSEEDSRDQFQEIVTINGKN